MTQTAGINLRPSQVRHGHHDVVPELDNLDLLRIRTLLLNPLLSSTQGTQHSVLDALGAGLVIPLDVVHEILGTFKFPFAR